MEAFDLALALVTATVLMTGLFSQPIKKSPLQEPMIAVGVGVLAGPQVAGLVDPDLLTGPGRLLEEASRVTLAIALMGIALRLEPGSMWPHRRPVAVLLTGAMLGMWFATALLVCWILGLPPWLALLVGAVAAPTDPVAASAIVTGPLARQLLPDRLRITLSLESGANDGLAYLLVMIPLLVLTLGWEGAWRPWLLDTLLLGVAAAALLGLVIGWAAGRLLHWAHGRGYIERYSYLTFTVCVSLFTLAVGHLLGAESLLAVFVAGLAFDQWSDAREKHDEENVQEAVGKLCTLPVFLLFGIALPVEGWQALGWPLALLCVAVLLLRRLPILAALRPLMGPDLTGRDVAFLAWFGPIGVAAIFYGTYVARRLGDDMPWLVVSALVLASVLAHGLTAAPFSRLYGRSADHRRD